MDLESPYRIIVDVQTKYLAEQSDPSESRFAFSYTISIYNAGTMASTLISRRWEITNANGDLREIEGKGVVGEQPYLHPGETFRYTSGAVINTPVGTMEGCYTMLADDGKEFIATILPFRLSVPEMVH